MLKDKSPVILKDTEVYLTNKDVSPQYSLRSQDSGPAESHLTVRRDSLETRGSCSSRHNSLQSDTLCPTLSRQSSLTSVSLYPSRHNSLSGGSSKEPPSCDPGLVVLEEEIIPTPEIKTVPDCKNDRCELTEKVSLFTFVITCPDYKCNNFFNDLSLGNDNTSYLNGCTPQLVCKNLRQFLNE